MFVRDDSRPRGDHLCVYPFAGRLAHEGLAAILAWRLTQKAAATFTTAANDYGFELVTQSDGDWAQWVIEVLRDLDLESAIFNALNLGELARREFREVARISGLVFEGYPGAGKSHRQIQASSGLLFDVFSQHDPDNLMLRQARLQVLQKQFEFARLTRAVAELNTRRWVVTTPSQHTPFSLPLMIERIQDTQSSETLEQRVRRLTDQWI